MKTKHAYNKIHEINTIYGKKHNNLVRTLNFTTPRVLKINMKLYISTIIEEFPEELSGKKKPIEQKLIQG
jgi:hypothetical protein